MIELVEPSAPGLLAFTGGDIFGDVAALAGSIWVATRRGLIQVDPADRSAVWHLGVGEGLNITIPSTASRSLTATPTAWYGFDPQTLTEQATISVEGGPEGIVAAEDGVWVTQHFAGSISRIDPATNTVVEAVAATSPGRRGPMDPAFAGPEIWSPCPRSTRSRA